MSRIKRSLFLCEHVEAFLYESHHCGMVCFLIVEDLGPLR